MNLRVVPPLKPRSPTAGGSTSSGMLCRCKRRATILVVFCLFLLNLGILDKLMVEGGDDIQRPEVNPINNYNFTVAICAIVKDMDAYLTEWLDYHLVAMNIKSIYLYDNSKRYIMKQWHANTRNHPLYRRVHVVHWPFRPNAGSPQETAYENCVNTYKVPAKGRGGPVMGESNRLVTEERHEYFALIDGDEFIMPKGNYTSVHGVIEDYLAPYGGALTMNWMLLGSANKTFYSPVPVTKRFQYRDEEAFTVIKSIVKASDFKKIRTVHSVFLNPGKLVRTTLYPGAVHKEAQDKKLSTTGASDSQKPSSALLLYHYRYLSMKEYDDKNCLRHHVSGVKACNQAEMRAYTLEELKKLKKKEHYASRPGVVFDDSAWKILIRRVPKYRMFDDELAWGDYT
ncbi:hypothetical protein ACHAWF_005349 [Thalassiosira exigua]